MKFINWIKSKERLRNGAMWVAITSQGLLAAQLLGVIFGYSLTAEFSTNVLAAVNAILIVLSTLGIVSNPTKPNNSGFNL